MLDFIEAYEKLSLLTEQRNPLTESTAQKIVEEVRSNMISLFGEERIRKVPVNFKLNSGGIQGDTGLGRGFGIDKNIPIEVNINKNLLYEGLEDLCLNNLYHEFCHVIVFLKALDLGYYGFDNLGNVITEFPNGQLELDYEDRHGSGHGKEFLDLAAKINSQINLRFPVSSYVTNEMFDSLWGYHEKNAEKTFYTIKLVCKKCNSVYYFPDTNDIRDIAKDIWEVHICGRVPEFFKDELINAALIGLCVANQTQTTLRGFNCIDCGAENSYLVTLNEQNPIIQALMAEVLPHIKDLI